MNTETLDQTEQMRASIKEIMPDARFTTTLDIDSNVATAKANINGPITGDQLESITYFALENDMDYLIKRSGAELVIEFNKK